MTHVTSGYLQKNFGLYRAVAMREPVTVTNHGREDFVILSINEYRRLKSLDKRSFHVSQLTDDEMQMLDRVIIPPSAADYDNEA